MRRFRRTLFGYAPRAVDRHIARLEERLKSATERQGIADELRAVLKRHLAQVQAEIADLRAEREHLANRIVAADAEALRIRREAMADAERLRHYWRAQEEEAIQSLQALREQIDAAPAGFTSCRAAADPPADGLAAECATAQEP